MSDQAQDSAESSLAFLSNTHLIHFLSEKDSMSAFESKTLFDRYSSNGSYLGPDELRGLFFDILRHAALPPVIGDEAFQSAKCEFSFDLSEKKVVSAEEFRNFFVYCHTKPFEVLTEVLGREFPEKAGQLSGRALVFSFFAPEDCTEVQPAHLEQLKAELNALLGGRESRVLSVSPFFCESRLRFDFFVVFGEGHADRVAENAENSPIRLNGRILKCRAYRGEELPRPEMEGAPVAAGMAATGVVFLKRGAMSVSKFADDMGAKEKLKGLNQSTQKIVECIDAKTNISGLTKSLGDSTRRLVDRASAKAAEIDRDHSISATVAEKMKCVREKPAVQKGVRAVSEWFGAAKESVSRFSMNTMELVERKMQNGDNGGAGPNGCGGVGSEDAVERGDEEERKPLLETKME